MDLQKEREAFEKHIQIVAHPHRSPKVMFFTVNDGHGNIIYADSVIQDQWITWQAAIKHVVPDGFVLVPKEPNKQFKNVLSRYLDELWMGEWGCDWDGFVSVNGIDPNEIWQFMIEAQEQAND